jgi:hypothetical protein
VKRGRIARWQVRIAALGENVFPARRFELHSPFEDEKETLCLGGPERATRFDLGGILREGCSHSWTRMNDCQRAVHSRQRSADERIWRQKRVIGLQ